jgi:hypothetical protein
MEVTELPITWKELLQAQPDMVYFIQWAAGHEGGLPDGNVKQADYERLKALYEAAG